MPAANALVVPLALDCAPTISMMLFFNTVKAPPMVWTSLASSRSWPRAFGSASDRTAEVSLPSSAILRSAPTGTLMPSASAFIRRGAASLTELNSSPRSTPEAKAWDSCSMAEKIRTRSPR